MSSSVGPLYAEAEREYEIALSLRKAGTRMSRHFIFLRDCIDSVRRSIALDGDAEAAFDNVLGAIHEMDIDKDRMEKTMLIRQDLLEKQALEISNLRAELAKARWTRNHQIPSVLPEISLAVNRLEPGDSEGVAVYPHVSASVPHRAIRVTACTSSARYILTLDYSSVENARTAVAELKRELEVFCQAE